MLRKSRVGEKKIVFLEKKCVLKNTSKWINIGCKRCSCTKTIMNFMRKMSIFLSDFSVCEALKRYASGFNFNVTLPMPVNFNLLPSVLVSFKRFWRLFLSFFIFLFGILLSISLLRFPRSVLVLSYLKENVQQIESKDFLLLVEAIYANKFKFAPGKN